MNINLVIIVLLVVSVVLGLFAMVYTHSRKKVEKKETAKETVENFIIEKLGVLRSMIGL